MKKLIMIFALIALIVIISGCPKPCVEANLSFSINVQYIPDNDSIKVGDTLYLLSTFSTQLQEQTSGRVIDYSNSTGIGSDLSISKLPLDDTIAKDAVSDFSYVSIYGKIYNDSSIPSPGRVQQLLFGETNNNYILKIGLIPQQKGNYILGIGNGLSNGRKKSNNCEKAAFNISITNTDQHFYILTDWNPNLILNDYGKMHGYAFKVY